MKTTKCTKPTQIHSVSVDISTRMRNHSLLSQSRNQVDPFTEIHPIQRTKMPHVVRTRG